MLGRCAAMAVLGSWLVLATTLPADDQAAFPWKDGDKVALIGGTVIEREQNFGHWEAALTRSIPAKNVTFRNLGWSGDTVWAESRGLFEPSDSRTPLGSNAGYTRLIQLVKEQKPSVLIMGYGQVEGLDGPSRLEPFLQQYERLINDCRAVSVEDVRVILLGPMDLVSMPAPLPSPKAQNQNIAMYREAIRVLASRLGAKFVDLKIPDAKDAYERKTLTDNGQHLTDQGYDRSASQLVSQLTPGNFREIKTGDVESLRQTIHKKNQFFFHRHRPQNVTYIFLFRKHEQGNNAVDIPKYDPLIAELEQQIARAVP